MSTPPQPGLTLVDSRLDEVTGRPQPILAQSRAGRVLAQHIQNYLEGRVCGRSCLIAGARGSGKTTLVRTAFDSVRDRVSGMRPILVRLHGPSLLDPSSYRPLDSKTPALTDEQKIRENVLRTVVINLYQTLAEEFATAYRMQVMNLGRSVEFPRDALERAAQLRLALDGAPNAALLRDFWEAIQALETGVLFAEPPRPDQGFREIVALATTAEAYRSCAGELKRTDKDTASAGHQEDLKLQAEAKGKELGQALIALVAGLAVGSGAVAARQSISTSAIAGAITAVLSLATLTYTNSFSRETSVKQEIEFLPDLSANALVHRLPLLLRRLRQAGVVPVFIIDELDKVPKVARPLNDLIAHLKFLCADQAFFCFLTDRGYLSDVARLNLDSNTPLLTVFTDTFFVLYETSSFREYLTEIIRQQSETEDVELAYDIQALQFELVHRSQMLAFNLAREIADLVEPDKRLRLLPLEPRSDPTQQMYLVLQLAVEVVLGDRQVGQRVRQDPNFGQILYDALYYPTKKWFQGRQELDCSLNALMAGIAETYAPRGVPERGVRREVAFLDQLEQDDKEFLHSQVRYLLDIVCDRSLLHKSLGPLVSNGIVWPVVADIVNIAPLLLVRVSEDKYEWKYNRFGIPFETAEINDVLEQNAQAGAVVDAIVSQIGVISVAPALEDILDGLTPAMAIATAFESSLRDLSPLVT